MWFHPDSGNRSDVPKFQPPLRGVGVTGPPQIQDQIIPMHSAHWERSAMLFFSSPSWEGMTQAMGTSWTEWVNGTNIKLNEGLCIHWYPLPFLKTKGLFGDFILLKRPNLMSPWFSMICKMACMVVRMYCECMDEFLNLCSNPNMNRTSSNSFGDRGARYSQLTGTTRPSVRRDSESKNLCRRQKSRYGRQKKTIVIFQRPVFEEWMLPNFRDLAHNLECKKSKNTWHQLSHWISIKACCPTVLVQNTATPVSPRRKGQTADTPTLSHLIVTVYVWP